MVFIEDEVLSQEINSINLVAPNAELDFLLDCIVPIVSFSH